MYRPNIDDLFAGRQSKYALVIGVAKRAREIAREAQKSGTIITEKPVILAARDFKEHKYSILEPEIDE
mgnify:FL=1